VIRIRHGRVSLALHPLRGGAGTPLLWLHALRACGSDGQAQAAARAWPGPVFGLDFSGHGASEWVGGGAYSPELLAGDADAALAHLGGAHLAGAGVGAYVALLLAGARPDTAPAALLLAGAGLAGGGAVPDPRRPTSEAWLAASDARRPPPAVRPPCDPLLLLLESDVRPTDYAEAFAGGARRLLLAEDGEARPPWWQTAARAAAAERIPSADLAQALSRLAGV
jgi:pimeloyl-ACP methyl ester carboxylesterase